SHLSSEISDLDFLFGCQIELPEDHQNRRPIAEGRNPQRLLFLGEERLKAALSDSIHARPWLPARYVRGRRFRLVRHARLLISAVRSRQLVGGAGRTRRLPINLPLNSHLPARIL